MMKIIPAIDIINGQCVRLTKGDYDSSKVYHSNPVEVAKMFEGEGVTHLHLVDLDGAKQGKMTNWKILENIAQQTSLQIDFGGGLQSNQDLRIAFDSGASQITAGSIAIKNRELVLEWIQFFGSQKIILGADVSEEKIAINGWQKITDTSIWDFLEDYSKQGIQTVICTDIQKDGLLQGTSTDLYQKIKQQFPELQLIASGGVSSIQDIEQLVEINVYGVVVGKALYEHKILLKDLKAYFL